MNRILLAVIAIFCIVLANGVYYIFHGQDKSVAKLDNGEDLSIYECCSIYSMHCAVWMFGWPIAPEAAYEAKLMCVPHDKQVEIRNNFFINSNVVKTSNGHPKWNVSDYNILTSELRYALALNSKNTTIVKEGDFNCCYLRVEYTNDVHSILNIPFHTRLFCHLQDRGWLHPYNLVYYDPMP